VFLVPSSVLSPKSPRRKGFCVNSEAPRPPKSCLHLTRHLTHLPSSLPGSTAGCLSPLSRCALWKHQSLMLHLTLPGPSDLSPTNTGLGTSTPIVKTGEIVIRRGAPSESKTDRTCQRIVYPPVTQKLKTAVQKPLPGHVASKACAQLRPSSPRAIERSKLTRTVSAVFSAGTKPSCLQPPSLDRIRAALPSSVVSLGGHPPS
jgi:hypothetical protein